MMLALADKQMLIQALGQVIYDEVQAVVKPLHARIAALEAALADKTDAAFVRDYVAGTICSMEANHAGRADGTGVCLDDIRAGVADLVAAAVRDLPVEPYHVAWCVDCAG